MNANHRLLYSRAFRRWYYSDDAGLSWYAMPAGIRDERDAIDYVTGAV